MVAALLLVVGLSYADLRREQARALSDFIDEEAMLAETLAAALAPRLVHATEINEKLFAGLTRAAADEPVQRVLAVERSGRVFDLVSRSGGWPALSGDGELAELQAAARAQRVTAQTVSRPAAQALGLVRRMAVAAVAPVEGVPWSVLVVTSARRVRDRARVGTQRLIATAVVASLLVALFGYLVFKRERRTLALAERLRLAEATASLRERSEKIVESIPLGVLAVDGARRVTAVNPFLAARGARAGTFEEALPVDAAERAPLEALVEEAQRTRQPATARALKLHLSSEPREVDATAIPLGRPLPDADCFLVLDDRTELKQLERSLGRAEKLATIGTLAAGVAHEVGTPLGVISGRAEQLLARLADDEPAKKALSSILAQVDKVSTTIRQLLDFSRVRPVEAKPVAPTTALETARALLEHRYRQAKVKLTLDAPPSVPAVIADAGQLEQVLVNLLMNAVDACAVGGNVRASAALVDGQVELAVADDGCGIAPEHLPSVMDPFFTTKKRGQGTGLGLTIAADIVKNHGGTLSIDSTVGRGTTVRVRLPRSAT
jgi:signal transduction histidine kinase